MVYVSVEKKPYAILCYSVKQLRLRLNIDVQRVFLCISHYLIEIYNGFFLSGKNGIRSWKYQMIKIDTLCSLMLGWTMMMQTSFMFERFEPLHFRVIINIYWATYLLV